MYDQIVCILCLLLSDKQITNLPFRILMSIWLYGLLLSVYDYNLIRVCGMNFRERMIIAGYLTLGMKIFSYLKLMITLVWFSSMYPLFKLSENSQFNLFTCCMQSYFIRKNSDIEIKDSFYLISLLISSVMILSVFYV